MAVGDKMGRLPRGQREMDGAGNRSRTYDLRITNALLYQLSYSGIFLQALPTAILTEPEMAGKFIVSRGICAILAQRIVSEIPLYPSRLCARVPVEDRAN